MSLTDFRNNLRYNPPIVPDLFWLTYNSVTRAAFRSHNPDVFQAWITELENYVTLNGQFPHWEVGYLPIGPPPLAWQYACEKCRFYINPNACTLVEGEIGTHGWCSVWSPPDSYVAGQWVSDFAHGNW